VPTEYITRVTRVHVMPKDHAIFSHLAFVVAIEDDAAGEYLSVSQCNDENNGKILIDPNEWEVLKSAISSMIDRLNKCPPTSP
jgi:hypothetical protein